MIPETKVWRMKRMFDCEFYDDSSCIPVEEAFKSLFFFVLTDTIIFSVLLRFDYLVQMGGVVWISVQR